eukprot:8010377-Lingulodinium_polyedra.AAC.1
MAQLTTGVRPTVVSRSSDHARVRFNGSQASGQSLSSQPRTCAAREQGHAFSMAEAQALGQLPEDNHMSSHVQAGALVSITQFNRRSRGRSLGRMAAFTLVHSAARAQHTVALSRAESELYALCSAVQDALHFGS